MYDRSLIETCALVILPRQTLSYLVADASRAKVVEIETESHANSQGTANYHELHHQAFNYVYGSHVSLTLRSSPVVWA